VKEIPLVPVLSALTGFRVRNAGKTLAAAAAGCIVGKPFSWGAPYFLTIEPTNLCDLHCPHCETGTGMLSRPAGYMAMDLYRHILALNHRHLICLQLYNQGEPLLHPQFPEMVRLAKQYGLCVISSTNGQRLADRAYAFEIAASGLDALILSIDGISQTTYARHRRGGSLEKVLHGLACLREARDRMARRTPLLIVQFVVMRHNEHELAQLRSLSKEWGADRLLIKSLYLHDAADAEEFLPASERYRRYQLHAGDLLRKQKSSRPCPRLCYSSVILWDGNVVPCCFDKDGTYPVGQAFEPLAELYHGKAIRDFRSRQSSADAPQICQNCSDGLELYPS
jgi:MoaA/NifB/PqqE/SkfB family radical SAM enzyme